MPCKPGRAVPCQPRPCHDAGGLYPSLRWPGPPSAECVGKRVGRAGRRRRFNVGRRGVGPRTTCAQSVFLGQASQASGRAPPPLPPRHAAPRPAMPVVIPSKCVHYAVSQVATGAHFQARTSSPPAGATARPPATPSGTEPQPAQLFRGKPGTIHACELFSTTIDWTHHRDSCEVGTKRVCQLEHCYTKLATRGRQGESKEVGRCSSTSHTHARACVDLKLHTLARTHASRARRANLQCQLPVQRDTKGPPTATPPAGFRQVQS